MSPCVLVGCSRHSQHPHPPHALDSKRRVKLECLEFIGKNQRNVSANMQNRNIKKRQNGRCDGDEVDRPSLYIASDMSMSS